MQPAVACPSFLKSAGQTHRRTWQSHPDCSTSHEPWASIQVTLWKHSSMYTKQPGVHCEKKGGRHSIVPTLTRENTPTVYTSMIPCTQSFTRPVDSHCSHNSIFSLLLLVFFFFLCVFLFSSRKNRLLSYTKSKTSLMVLSTGIL